MGPETLSQVLRKLPKFYSDKLIVGLDTSDDAAVYKLDDEKAIIATLDFFTPIVDDPYTYGQIAAANSLSDVYAMGGEPIIALNIVGFPNCLSPDILSEIMRGGAEKVDEAGAILVGGHSIEDNEPKYGLSVIGLVHPDKVLANSGVKEGDVLILTKPIGSGIVNTAIKAELASDEEIGECVDVMRYLNKYAAQAIKGYDVNACTDITGFGLIGHIYEMASGSGVTIRVDSKSIPFVSGAAEYARMGIITAGSYRNRDYIKGKYSVGESVEEYEVDIMFDPQTSGGLLISVEESKAVELVQRIGSVNSYGAVIIGKAMALADHDIEIV